MTRDLRWLQKTLFEDLMGYHVRVREADAERVADIAKLGRPDKRKKYETYPHVVVHMSIEDAQNILAELRALNGAPDLSATETVIPPFEFERLWRQAVREAKDLGITRQVLTTMVKDATAHLPPGPERERAEVRHAYVVISNRRLETGKIDDRCYGEALPRPTSNGWFVS